MEKKLWNDGWIFWKEKNAFALIWSIPEDAEQVTLPHDAMISENVYADSPNGVNTGFRDGTVCNYVKKFKTVSNKKDSRVMVKFEGIYMNAFVYLNGVLVADHPYGYTSFFADLTDGIRYDEENELRIQVRNSAMPNSRWYSGTGIYRDVYLMTGPDMSIVPQGIRIDTERLDGISEDYSRAASAELMITTEINGGRTGGNAVLLTEIKDCNGNCAGTAETEINAVSEETVTCVQKIRLTDTALWSDLTPVMYRCCSSLVNENETDTDCTEFGIRDIRVSAAEGLLVNGRRVLLRGAGIHHDSGLIGGATYEEVEQRRIARLKGTGFNAIRTAHNPAADALLHVCDRLGIYVMDEFSDAWTRSKADYDYSLFFNEWWKKDITSIVRKDWSHPSVIIYSIGNEIPEIGSEAGARMCADIAETVHLLDNTRFVTAAVNGVFAAGDAVGTIMHDLGLSSGGLSEGANVNEFLMQMDSHLDEIVMHDAVTERLDRAAAALDIAGYNYMTARYASDAVNRKDRVIVGSETYPPKIALNWDIMQKQKNVIGDFTWVGWGYLGEAGVGIPAYKIGEGGLSAGFPCQNAYCGDFDITGFRRPASYFREIVWGFRRQPYIAVQDPAHYGEVMLRTPWIISDAISSWTYHGFEGKNIVVEVYSGGDEIELLLNGRSLGRKKAGKGVVSEDKITDGYRVLFETVYEPGILTAVSYEKGMEIGRFELTTAGKFTSVKLNRERLNSPNGLEYIDIELIDDKGNVVTDSDMIIKAELSENVRLMGFGSADPKSQYNYTGNVTRTYNGRALLIVKTENESGIVTLRAGDQGAAYRTAVYHTGEDNEDNEYYDRSCT